MADLAAVKHDQSRFVRKLREIDIGAALSQVDDFDDENERKNAPSRWPLRPVSRLTAAEAAVRLEPINLRCSVLGALGTLRSRDKRVKVW